VLEHIRKVARMKGVAVIHFGWASLRMNAALLHRGETG
jgi:hypothetical protein